MNIINYNNKGELHGYIEMYWGSALWFKGFYNNTIRIDYEECYLLFDFHPIKRFYI